MVSEKTPPAGSDNPSVQGVPMPIVKLNRWFILVGVLSGLIFQQPLVITFIFLCILPAVLGGQHVSPVAIIGKRIFSRQIPTAQREDARLMKFNNVLALTLLFLAQAAFFFGFPVPGWIFSLMVALAAAVALMGFCLGCFLFFQYNQLRFRLRRH